jgi:azobenzene reductase
MSKVLVLTSSASSGSRTLGLGRAIAENLQQKGAQVELIDLIELGLPTYNYTVEKQDSYDDKTRQYLDKCHQADAFVWVTPVYHNSFSSLLKTALDWQHFWMDGKVVAMASHGGGRSTAPLDQLSIVARSQHLLSTVVRVCTVDRDFDDQKQLTAAPMLDRVDKFCAQLLDYTTKFAA